MRIIDQGIEVIKTITLSYEQMVSLVYKMARISYLADKASDAISEQERFIRARVEAGHESVIEHATISVEITCNRGVSHELVRHRIASYTQESTRFCNYTKDRFGGITFIKPCYLPAIPCGEYSSYVDIHNTVQEEKLGPKETLWLYSRYSNELTYNKMIDLGMTAQEARDNLPLATKTVVGVTMNLRQWRDTLKKRALGTTGTPHPQMLEVATQILASFKQLFPIFFYDM